MKKSQWIVAGMALATVICVYSATVNQVFGDHRKQVKTEAQAPGSVITIDSILHHAKEHLSPEQISRLAFLENSITRGDVHNQKLHLYHQLARFWKDSAEVFEPYVWYTAEAARLENSENSLTFAAHLFLDNLKPEENPSLRQWKALQAKDLFERSLKINPANDSSEIGLGVLSLYGGLGTPMEGIQRIRKVVEKNPGNVYAQLALGHASVTSGQLDKAIERFENVHRIEPDNLEAILSLADVYERQEDKTKAIEWYKKSLPLIKVPPLKEEVKKRIADLEKK